MNKYEPRISSTLQKVNDLAPEIVARADEIERERGVPADLMAKLKEAGIFRMMVPRSYGGDELHPVEVSRILEALGRADASAAWNAMVAVGFNIVFGRLPKATTDRVFASTPDVMVRGALAPKGKAVPVEGGYMVSGRWPLASGSFDPELMVGQCMVFEDGKPKRDEKGAPVMLVALTSADKATFIDTWDSVGLRGSASHDFELEEHFVPEADTAKLFGPASYDVPLHRMPFFAIAGPTHASVALGIAQGALDDLTSLSRSKRPAMRPDAIVSADPVFSFRLGELLTRLQVARAALERCNEDLWAATQADGEIPMTEVFKAAAVGAHLQIECREIVDVVFTLAGSNPCYNSSLLQRRWRDIRCLCQHTAASTTNAFSQLGSTAVASA